MKSIFTILLLAPLSFLHAQLVCTDPADAKTYPLDSVDLDIDNDATSDFRIRASGSSNVGFVSVAANMVGSTNAVLTSSNGVLALPLNTSIGPTSTSWTPLNNTDQLMAGALFSSFFGEWSGAIDQYLGLQFVSGNNTYYGWARFTFFSDGLGFVLKDYAYNSVPNQSIAAGQGCAPLNAASFYLDTNSCHTNSTMVTANSGTLPASGFTWSALPLGPVFSSPNGSTTSLSFPTTGTFVVGVAVQSNSNVLTAQHTVVVNPNPTISAVANPSLICIYDFGAMFTITATGAPTFTFMDISLPPFSQTVAVGNSYSDYAFSLHSLFYIVGMVNGCTGWDTVSVYQLGLPEFTITPPPSVCAGSTVALQAIPASHSYTWSGVPSPIYGSTAIVTPLLFPAQYTVTASNGACTETASVSVLQKTISVSAFPATDTICVGESVELSATGASVYLWQPPQFLSSSSGATVLAYPTSPTSYTVVGIHTTCMDTAVFSLFVDPCEFIPEQHLGKISLAPNPAANELEVTITQGQMMEVRIYDLSGRILKAVTEAKTGTVLVDLSELPSASYVLRIMLGDGTSRYARFLKVE